MAEFCLLEYATVVAAAAAVVHSLEEEASMVVEVEEAANCNKTRSFPVMSDEHQKQISNTLR